MSRYLENQPANVRAAYELLYSSAEEHSSSTAVNCAHFILAWNNEHYCGWGPASIVNRDAEHQAAIFTIMQSLGAGIWYPPPAHVDRLKKKFAAVILRAKPAAGGEIE